MEEPTENKLFIGITSDTLLMIEKDEEKLFREKVQSGYQAGLGIYATIDQLQILIDHFGTKCQVQCMNEIIMNYDWHNLDLKWLEILLSVCNKRDFEDWLESVLRQQPVKVNVAKLLLSKIDTFTKLNCIIRLTNNPDVDTYLDLFIAIWNKLDVEYDNNLPDYFTADLTGGSLQMQGIIRKNAVQILKFIFSNVTDYRINAIVTPLAIFYAINRNSLETADLLLNYLKGDGHQVKLFNDLRICSVSMFEKSFKRDSVDYLIKLLKIRCW